MVFLVKFDGNVSYAKLAIPEVEYNIPDGLRRNICSKSSPLIR